MADQIKPPQIKPAQIKTARLVLRPFTLADGDAVVAGLSNFEVSKWLSRVQHPFTHADLRLLREDGSSKWPDLMAITHQGRVVGAVSTGEHLGYWLLPDAWGKGIATEASVAAIAHFFEVSDKDVLTSGYFVGNAPSAKVLRKLGFKPVGARSLFCVSQNQDLPFMAMELSRADWGRGRRERAEGILLTERLQLCPARPEHAAAVARGVGNINVARWIPPVPHPYTKEHAATFISKIAQPFPRHAFIFKEGALIGSVAIGDELGYWIAEECWGHGYASEAVRRMVDAYFLANPALALASNHARNNYRSAGVLHKMGFRPTGGKRRSHVMSTGETVDLVELRLERRGWEAATLEGAA